MTADQKAASASAPIPGHRSFRDAMTAGPEHSHYKWVALTNTTLGMLLATINSSIVLISLPAIFNGVKLDPLQPGNVSYLLWMLMGYMLVTAVLVVTLGRIGDMFGRVKVYNLGFAIFTVCSVILSLDPFTGSQGALWLIGWRVVQAVGGAMLMANSAAIITDAFPAKERGTALGINIVAALAGSFIGLVLGGVLADWNWRSIFWVNVPIGLIGTVWAYKSLHETSERRPGKIDWWGNLSFAIGLTALLAAITYGIQPYGGHTMGWTNPLIIAGLVGGIALLAVFLVIESKVAEPMFPLSLFRNRVFAGGNAAMLMMSVARGGLQFMLIIWLQGIWLPLHGYSYSETPLWAGIYLVPLTIGFLVAGPAAGRLSDRLGARGHTGQLQLLPAIGMLLMAATFGGMLLLPTDFNYLAFALLIALNGLGSGLFSAPNANAIMSSVPAHQRGAASGMRATFQNSGMVLSIGLFFSLMVVGLAGSLPTTLSQGLIAQNVPAAAAHSLAALPPVGVLFAAFLGYNPIQHLLGSQVLNSIPPKNAATLTGQQFFPHLISTPFHDGLVVVFWLAIIMSLLGAATSFIRAPRSAGQAGQPGAGPGETASADAADAPVPALVPAAGYESGAEIEPAILAGGAPAVGLGAEPLSVAEPLAAAEAGKHSDTGSVQ
ncbi:MAG TPA: MFS transporter [Actinocrinis sp.]|nr:MFS transporter [Actinocrinis sp.]